MSLPESLHILVHVAVTTLRWWHHNNSNGLTCSYSEMIYCMQVLPLRAPLQTAESLRNTQARMCARSSEAAVVCVGGMVRLWQSTGEFWEAVCALPILPLLPWWLLYLQTCVCICGLCERVRVSFITAWQQVFVQARFVTASHRGTWRTLRISIRKQDMSNKPCGTRGRSFYGYKLHFLIQQEGNCLLWMWVLQTGGLLRCVLIVPTCKCVCGCVRAAVDSWETGSEQGLDKSTAPAAAELR